MVNLEHFGFNSGRLILNEPGTLNTDRFGLDTATAQWKTGRDDFGYAPELGSQHPIWSWLYMEKRRLEISQGFLIITGEYVGITGGRTQSIWEACYASSEEDIQTHPDFTTTLAGTASNVKHGAIFVDIENPNRISTSDDRGVFTEFRTIVGGSRNLFAGIRAYLSPQVTVRETWMSTSRVSAIDVGKISVPGQAPLIQGNWLKTGASFTQRGRVYANSQEWRSSGRNLWNTDIYS